MIIDNLKEFIAKFTESHQKNNDRVEEHFEPEEVLGEDLEFEEEIEGDEIINIPEEPLGGISDPDPYIVIPDVYGPPIPNDEIDEPAPCVYGPPSW